MRRLFLGLILFSSKMALADCGPCDVDPMPECCDPCARVDTPCGLCGWNVCVGRPPHQHLECVESPHPPFRPANYWFHIGQVRVETARSRFNDTVWGALKVQTGGSNLYDARRMGDFGSGETFSGGITLGPVWISDPNQIVQFSTAFLNDSGSASEVLPKLNTSVAHIQQRLDEDDPILQCDSDICQLDPSLIGWIFNVLVDVYQFVFPDCDGPVAMGGQSVTARTIWDRSTCEGNRWAFQYTAPGTDSPPGCGSNSRYVVTVVATHD